MRSLERVLIQDNGALIKKGSLRKVKTIFDPVQNICCVWYLHFLSVLFMLLLFFMDFIYQSQIHASPLHS